MVDQQRPPGWLPDPSGRYQFRWFNGQSFTGDVSVGGNRFVDPLPLVHISERRTRGMAVAGFVVALIAAMLAWLPFVFVVGGVAAIVAFVLSLLGLRAARRNAGYGRALAASGVAISVLAAGLTVAGFYFTRYAIRELDKIGELGEYQVAVDACRSSDGLTVFDGHITNLDDEQHGYYVAVEFLVRNEVTARRNLGPVQVSPGETANLHLAEFIESGPVECRVAEVSAGIAFP